MILLHCLEIFFIKIRNVTMRKKKYQRTKYHCITCEISHKKIHCNNLQQKYIKNFMIKGMIKWIVVKKKMVTTGSSQNFKMDQVSLKRKFSLSLVFRTGLNWLGPNLNIISSMEEWTEPIQPTLEYLCFEKRWTKST